MSCQKGLEFVCKKTEPKDDSIEEEEEWTKNGPLSYL